MINRVNPVAMKLPADWKPYAVGRIRATREQLRSVWGEPHFVQTEPCWTAGGDEDCWGWELPTGRRIGVVLYVAGRASHRLRVGAASTRTRLSWGTPAESRLRPAWYPARPCAASPIGC